MSTLNLGNSLIMNSDIVIGQEIKTGGTFNGKPIYCYTNTLTGTENSAGGYNVVYGAVINNLKEVLALEGFGISPGWNGSPLPYVYFNSNGTVQKHWELWMASSTIAANFKGVGNSITIRYTVYYTKTTD